jgi:hypothetical protein
LPTLIRVSSSTMISFFFFFFFFLQYLLGWLVLLLNPISDGKP